MLFYDIPSLMDNMLLIQQPILFILSIIYFTGPSVPNTPINVTSTDIQYNAAVINWLVTNISYTPEQYIVYYGLTSTALTNTSTVLYGTEDFSDINKMLSIELVDLIFNTDYYYIVSSTNTEGTANSPIGMFRTKQKRKYIFCCNNHLAQCL